MARDKAPKGFPAHDVSARPVVLTARDLGAIEYPRVDVRGSTAPTVPASRWQAISPATCDVAACGGKCDGCSQKQSGQCAGCSSGAQPLNLARGPSGLPVGCAGCAGARGGACACGGTCDGCSHKQSGQCAGCSSGGATHGHASQPDLVELWKDHSRLVYATRMLGYASAASPALQRAAEAHPGSPFAPLLAMWVVDNHVFDGQLTEAVQAAAAWEQRWSGSEAFGVRLDDLVLRAVAQCHRQLGDVPQAVATMERLVSTKRARAQLETEDWLTLGELAEDTADLAKAAWAYNEAARRQGPASELARRNLLRLRTTVDHVRPKVAALARELYRALREGDARALHALASKTHFTLGQMCGESTFTDPEVILPSLLEAVRSSDIRAHPDRLEGCGAKRYLATDGWRGDTFAGRVLFLLRETRHGWEWGGVGVVAPVSGARKLMREVYGEPSKYENQPLEIEIKAPWPAGISMRAGAGSMYWVFDIVGRILFAEFFGGFWHEFILSVLSGVDDCGFGPGGFYYRDGSHLDNTFAIDFTRYPRGQLDFLGTSNLSRGTPILAVADGHIQELAGDGPSGGDDDNYAVQRIWKSASIELGAGWPSSPTPTELRGLENAMTPYHARYDHMMGPDLQTVVFGQFVEQGFVLGLMNDTGTSWMDHLHFEVTDLRIPWAGHVYGGTVRPSPMDGALLRDEDIGRCVTSTNRIRNPVAMCATLGALLGDEYADICRRAAAGDIHDPTYPDPYGSNDPFADRELCFRAYTRLLTRVPPAPPEVLRALWDVCIGLPNRPLPTAERPLEEAPPPLPLDPPRYRPPPLPTAGRPLEEAPPPLPFDPPRWGS